MKKQKKSTALVVRKKEEIKSSNKYNIEQKVDICPQCHASVTYKIYNMKNINTNMQGKKFVCEKCGYTYTTACISAQFVKDDIFNGKI